MNCGPCLHYDCSNRNSFGYCSTTVCINDLYLHEQWEGTSAKDEKVIDTMTEHRLTNAMKIRLMSDEEMADFFRFISEGCDYIMADCPAYENCRKGDCKSGWIDWLKQEVE